ncbi:TetR/AcrR family transcriptional regulator [Puteibacter caeruleilacunae]|nr:TetR/AcrR family transcriptional regulator [Puteibacter caeruleilacunae]
MDDRSDILQKVGVIVFETGVKSLTMDTIAKKLGRSKKTLYKHFGDKEELISLAVMHRLSAITTAAEKLTPDTMNAIDKGVAIHKMMRNLLSVYNSHIFMELKNCFPETYDQVNRWKKEQFFQGMIEHLDEGQQQGLYREDLNIEVVAKFYQAQMLLTFNPEFDVLSEREVKSMDILKEALDYHLRAICTEKGIEYYKRVKSELK